MVRRQSPSAKLKLLDEYIQVLVRRFYLRPSADGSGAELSSRELFVCGLLGRSGRCTMTELASECGLALSSMTGLIDRLVEKGCVTRVREEEDRRKVFVQLDKKGQQAYQELLESEMEMIISMMDSLKPDEQENFLRLLEKCVSSLQR
jgi:MarR family transcriptional regulator, organic hydroperoxide resistance regulator